MPIAIPFFLLSYGDFVAHKRLFSYERNGVNTLPIFTDLSRATVFAGDMMRVLKEDFNDHRVLMPNVCNDRDKAIEMLETIVMYVTDLRHIVVDAIVEPNKEDWLDTLSNSRVIEDIHDVVDVIDSLRSSALDADEGSASSKIE